MEQKTKIRAIGRSLWIVTLAVMLLGIPLFFGKTSAGDLSDRIIFAIFIVTFGPYCIYRLCHDVYITEDGIECCRFGKVIRTLPWHQIAQVCIARNYRFSAKGSANTRIIITPRGCPAFSPQEWSGIQYLLAFRTQAVWIDNSPKKLRADRKVLGHHHPADIQINRCPGRYTPARTFCSFFVHISIDKMCYNFKDLRNL